MCKATTWTIYVHGLVMWGSKCCWTLHIFQAFTFIRLKLVFAYQSGDAWSGAASTAWIFGVYFLVWLWSNFEETSTIYYGKQSVIFVKKKIFSSPKLVKITRKARNSYSNTVLFGLVSWHAGNRSRPCFLQPFPHDTIDIGLSTWLYVLRCP